MWKMIQDPTSSCGQKEQTMDHILFRCPLGPHPKDFDLKKVTKKAWRGLVIGVKRYENDYDP